MSMSTSTVRRIVSGTSSDSPVIVYAVAVAVLIGLVAAADLAAGIATQETIGWGLLLLVVVLNRIDMFKAAPGRFFFIFTAALISIRYFLWRTFDTLIYTGPLDAFGMLLIYGAECYSLTIHFLGMFISFWPLESEPVPLPPDPGLLPTVDILVPTYNEDEGIIRLTLTAALQIDYPRDKFIIHLLDDGGTLIRRNTPETATAAWERHYRLKSIAAELGVRYITRETNSHAKSGNINHALRLTKSDLILLLDCDHVPTRDILRNTVGWFLKDPKLCLLQTPHFFINATTVEKNIGSFSNAPGENDMFHHGIQLGMDLWNASYFTGSGALLRRSYLIDAGCIAGRTVTEDAETSLRLHSCGYNSIYINRPMLCGLSPETFSDYIVQRTRWAQGMVQIFALSNPLLVNGLSLRQKLCYFNSCFFWFFSLARFIFYIGPGLFLIFGQKVYHASVSQIMAYAVPHVLCIFIVMDFLHGKLRRRFFSEIYESVQTLFLGPAVLAALLDPLKPSFRITPKGKKIEHEYLNPLATMFFMICVVNFIGIGFAIAKWIYYPLFRSVIAIAFVWCLYNMMLGLVTLGAFWERQQMRQHHRLRAKGKADILHEGSAVLHGEIKDLSLTGIGMEIGGPLPAFTGTEVRVQAMDSYGTRHELPAVIKTVRSVHAKTFLGLEFVMNDRTYPQIVAFVYGDSGRWQEILNERFQYAHSPKTALKDLYYFMQRGIRGSAERMAYLGSLAIRSGTRYTAKLAAYLYVAANRVAGREPAP